MMTVEMVAEAIKKGYTIIAPPINWISGHAYLERELLEKLREARDGLELSTPLARQKIRREIDEYLDTWNTSYHHMSLPDAVKEVQNDG